ncbi:MAG: radical SAM protein [Sulfurimonas sp.]|jgi:radical SAM protein with 4Fe4S-binding SPASM domain
MKAKIKKRIEDEDKRVELGSVLPLNTPYVLMIDPSSACNHSCRFCPTGDHSLIKESERFVGTLDFELYKKIIDDVNNFANPIKVLRLYKVGEPLLHPKFSEMIAYARANINIQKIETTTNGLLLHPELNQKIIDAGLSQINISVNGVNEEKIYHYTQTKIDFQKYVKNIKDLYERKENCEIYIKAIKQNLSEDEQKEFYDIFGSISDRIFLENLSPAWPEYKFNNMEMKFDAGHYGQEIIERNVCPFLFYVMVVNSDGMVSTCVQDWKQKMIVGDTTKETIQDIWLGSALNTYRIDHLNGNKKNYTACANCEVMSHGVLDNIDSMAQIIKSKMLASQSS